MSSELPPPPSAELEAEYRVVYRRRDRPEHIVVGLRNQHSAQHVGEQIATSPPIGDGGPVVYCVVERRLVGPWRAWRVFDIGDETAPTAQAGEQPQSKP